MERVAFLIERSLQRITCLLNPEDVGDSFVVERTSGAAREAQNSLSRTRMTDNPVIFHSRGDTRLTLKLLFDVNLEDSYLYTRDVRDLTRPIWQLAEYVHYRGSNDTLPRARFIWGRAWNIPVIVESVAERFEHFTARGVPQRSWMSLRLLRVSDEILAVDVPGRYLPADIPLFDEEPLLRPGWQSKEDTSWEVYKVVGGDTGGKQLWQIAAEKYGDSSLWRLIARANHIDDPSRIPAGTILRLPPLSMLRGKK